MRKPDAWRANKNGSPWFYADGPDKPKAHIGYFDTEEPLFRLTDAERAVLDAVAAGTHQLIPTEALKWLHGEGEDFECAPEHYFRGKAPPYWWRSEFRRRIEAAAPAPGGEGK